MVVYFDGVCSLCNAFVDFAIRRDTGRRLRYASQQGQAFAALKARHPGLTAGTETVVAAEPRPDGTERLYLESDATFAVLARLPGGWGWLRYGRLVPRPIRNFFYRLIARHRYRLFGKRETCRLPSPEERALFLD
ncbi:Predicted thiol-disulfide oxidoreductase YuxK, DCC family [Verrucomicrobium sp. GAS474]|uniref:thiol-disulfide oxidoreductase DCC family protein n=1 Tax=Verrucomicrobium sp. GAS474 TaxID=1882831 RepID=UPI00087BF33E|nr:DCC1-like thiol-disulfide oxidoreductase family protein [Verrucomicrobium sp. GAS474]SDU04820.1 Predicted thiol-disulfide oxidoreductase YuxK, DCC family [Verrucomicrobium sp. GAS474]